MDLKALTDEEFDTHENAVLNERERRNNLLRIPQSIAEQARQYVAGGGDLSDLQTAIAESPAPTEGAV